MAKWLPVQGTSSFRDDPNPALRRNWWRRGSALDQWLRPRGFEILHPEDPYVWTTDIVGWKFWRRWFGTSDSLRDWSVGGRALRWWITAKGVNPRDLKIWCHSHGLQPVLFAAAAWHEPIFCDTLVAFGSPLRADVPWLDALAKIGRVLIVTDRVDRIQLLGRIGDGAIGSRWEFPANVEILVIDGIDHSRLLQDPTAFELLEQRGVLAFTRNEADAYV